MLLVDGDEQGSAADFTALRGERAGYGMARCHGTDLRNRVIELSRNFDDTIIDVGGGDSGAMRAALLSADTVVIPVLPRVFDVWATSQMVDLVNEARAYNSGLVACAFINFSDTYSDLDTVNFLHNLRDVRVLLSKVGKRKIFSVAAERGKSVLEMPATNRTSKAQIEIRRLSAEIFGEK